MLMKSRDSASVSVRVRAEAVLVLMKSRDSASVSV
jgi:hypothetical protein